MIIKVCGMRDRDNIVTLQALDIDVIGFIFYKKSPRYFNIEGKIGALPKICKRAGVFVNSDFEEIQTIAKKMELDYIQLHGDESPSLCSQIQTAGYKVIKALHIKNCDDLMNINSAYHNCCNLFLFDTKCNGYGGSGVQFDWSIIDRYKGPTPFLLSGGIDINSIDRIKDIKNKYFMGIDLNSKFETSPGIKNIELLKDFITEIKK